MTTEIEACFVTFFNTINDIYNKYKDNNNNLSRNYELGETKNIYMKFFTLIKNELDKNQNTKNDACNFSNNVCNGFMQNQNALSVDNFLKNNLNILNGFTKESRETISKLSDMILLDNFKFNENDFKDASNNYNSEKLEFYLFKLQNDIFIKWKSNNSNYFSDINDLNIILQKCNKNYNNNDILLTSNCIIYGIDNLIKAEIIKFYESLNNKYIKLDKLNKKIKETKDSKQVKETTNSKQVKETTNFKQVKETTNSKPVKETTDSKTVKETKDSKIIKDKPVKEKKTKEKIPATVKNTLWRKYFNDNMDAKCQCCLSESISIKNFDCGHIISEKNGGSVSIDNLKPICRLCNSSMSTMNMQEFINKYGLNKEIHKN